MRLERHYAYKYCSPSRCAFLSGRLPLHVNQGQPQGVLAPGGVDLRMTTIAEKLQGANIETHFYGKWHAGQRSPANMPARHSFDQSLGFLTGAENHFTQIVADQQYGDKPRGPSARPWLVLVNYWWSLKVVITR